MESILNNTQPICAIPSFASVDEFALYTIASVEESYTDLCKSIGISELAAVMEANGKIDIKAKFKETVKKVVDFIKGLWQKFQGLIKKATDKFITFVTEKLSKTVKLKITAAELKEAIEASKPERWNWLDKSYEVNYTVANNILKAVSVAEREVADKINAAKENPDNIAEIDVAEIYGKVFKNVDLAEADYANAGKIQAAVKNAVLSEGKIDADARKNWAVNHASKYFAELKVNNLKSDFVNTLKAPYNGTKKALDDAINEAKKVNTDKALSVIIKSANNIVKINAAVVGAIQTAAAAEFSFRYKVLAFGLLAAVAKKEKKEEVKEAAVVESAPEPGKDEAPVTESSTFQTELASLFNF